MRERGLPVIQIKRKLQDWVSPSFQTESTSLKLSLFQGPCFSGLCLLICFYSSSLSFLLASFAYFSTGPQMAALALISHGLRLQCKQPIDHNPLSLLEWIPNKKNLIGQATGVTAMWASKTTNTMKRSIGFFTFPSFLYKVDTFSVMCTEMER